MFWKAKTPEPVKFDRKHEHDFAKRAMELWKNPDRDLALAILPHESDPEWEKGYHPVYIRMVQEIMRFKAMYAVMQEQSPARPERRKLEVVR